MEAEAVHNAMMAPLPPPAPGVSHSFLQGCHPPTDDEQLSEASLLTSLSQQQVWVELPATPRIVFAFSPNFAKKN